MGRGPTSEYHFHLAEGYVPGSMTCLTAETVMENAGADFPIVLNIEPTNLCNLNCYLCAGQTRARRKRGYMNFDLFRQIIDECAEHRQLHMINLHKDGEPLLHPDIYKMIRYAKEKNCAKTVHLNTNGILLTDADRLISSGLDDITISLDAFLDETYEKIKGFDGLHIASVNTMQLIQKRNRLATDKPFVRVKIMEYEETKNEIDVFFDFWKDIADQVQVTGIHNWSGAIEGVEITDETHRKPGRWPCVLLWYALAVNWDGRVSICNLDWDLSGCVGTLSKKNTIQSIWKSKKLRKIRQDMLNRKYDTAQICRKCVVWAGGEDMTKWLKGQKEFL